MIAERLIAAGFFLLGLALPLSLAASNAALGLLSLGLLLSLSTALRPVTVFRLKEIVSAPLFCGVGVYAAAALISSLGGVDAGHSLSIWPKDLQKLWVVAAAGAAIDAERRRLFVRGLAAGGAAAALIGIAQSLGSALGAQPYLRAHAFMHPVSYGESLGLIVLGLLAWDEDIVARSHRRTLLAAVLLALALNQTRAVLIALPAGLAAAALAEPRRRKIFFLALAAAAAAAGSWELLAGGRSFHAVLKASAESAQGARWILWRVAWNIFREHPFFGAGPGNFRALYPRYFTGVLDGERTVGSAHNLFLHQAAERGLIGLIGLGAVMISLALELREKTRRKPSSWTIWALSSCAAFFVMNMTETAFQTEQVATLFLITIIAARDRAQDAFRSHSRLQ